MHGGQPVSRKAVIGLVNWVGYSPILVADQKGFFKAAGIDVEVRMLNDPGARQQAFASGSIDLYPNTPDAFATEASEQPLPGKIVAALDESFGGDGIIALKRIGSVADLRGKTVACEFGITSHYLILKSLKEAGIPFSDVDLRNTPADEAGSAFFAGKVPAAVTWEPYLTRASKSTIGHVLKSSKDYPGLIVDCMMANDRITRDPEFLRRFWKAYEEALRYMEDDRPRALAIIQKGLGESSVEHVEEMLGKVRFFRRSDSDEYLRNTFPKVLKESYSLYKEFGTIKADAKPPEVSVWVP